MNRFLSLLMTLTLCLLLLTSCSTNNSAVIPENTTTVPPTPAEESLDSSDYAVVTVNGEDLMYSEYLAIETAYLYQYEAAGVDLTDESTAAYLKDLALTYAVEQMLVDQDMHAQGCYEFGEETEAWFAETGKAAYEQALSDVKAMFLTDTTTEDEAEVYALVYADSLGVTEQTYVDFYRTQYASENYRQWLIRENPITDESVQAAYDARVAESKALYENDVAAFETAMSRGAEVWYTPAGYRNVLQILLPAQGDTEEAKLASVQATLDEIYARLDQGEAFQALIIEYGADANFADESFMAAGYPVHKDSIVWDEAFVTAAFSAEMVEPGCVSAPVVSTASVHILYYLSDAASGAIELTEQIHDMLAAQLYRERYTAAQSERLNELAAAAEIVFH